MSCYLCISAPAKTFHICTCIVQTDDLPKVGEHVQEHRGNQRGIAIRTKIGLAATINLKQESNQKDWLLLGIEGYEMLSFANVSKRNAAISIKQTAVWQLYELIIYNRIALSFFVRKVKWFHDTYLNYHG
mmetsp:Transcript_35770/g.55030  ORF Transcript_35770/g.55030 Transcript_35770/m.55030 type:complete len:130 (+) Transcript_35770:115-504(+)